MSSAVFAIVFRAIRPSHFGQAMMSTANTRASSHAHGCRDGGLLVSSSRPLPASTSGRGADDRRAFPACNYSRAGNLRSGGELARVCALDRVSHAAMTLGRGPRLKEPFHGEWN